MNLTAALEQVKAGEKITRPVWGSDDLYACLHDGFLMIQTGDGIFRAWTISEIDLYARDWIIIKSRDKGVQ